MKVTMRSGPLTPLFVVICGLLLPLTAQARCPDNPSCSDFKQCKPIETFRIPFETIRRCIEEGYDPPLEWKRLKGKGAVNTGFGNISIGGLTSPYFPSPGEVAPGGSGPPGGPTPPAPGGIGAPASGPSGPSTQDPPDCSTYKSPYLLTACDLRGERRDVTDGPSGECGYTVELDHEWAVLKGGATHAIMTQPGSELEIYRKSGTNLSYAGQSEIPDFYCELRTRPGPDGTPELYAHQIPVSPNEHFAEYSSRTDFIPVSLHHSTSEVGSGLHGGFVVMRRTGTTSFAAPPPNPEWFLSRGAVDVDPNCYTVDRLVTFILPRGFGDIFFGYERVDSCESSMYYPHNYLDEPERCVPFAQFHDGYSDVLAVPPAASASYGTIQGGNSYSTSTVQAVPGNIATNADGLVYYDGPMLKLSNVNVYLDPVTSGPKNYTFPDGIRFDITDERMLEISNPGRIRVTPDYHMEVIDGGIIMDEKGDILWQVPANSSVHFEANQLTGTPIKGYISGSGSIVLQDSSVLPTNNANEILMPYDTRLDNVCEPDPPPEFYE